MLDKQPAVADHTVATFKVAQQAYLGEVSGITNLGNALVCQLRQLKKLVPVTFEDYLNRCQEWDRHLDARCLNYTDGRVTVQENEYHIFAINQNPTSINMRQSTRTLRST